MHSPPTDLSVLEASLELLGDVEDLAFLDGVTTVQGDGLALGLAPLSVELGGVPLSSGAGEEISSGQQVTRKSTRKERHQRKKSELQYLRTQVAKLEKQLDGLQQLRVLGNDSPLTSLWERAAKNQQRERLRAEVENAKLRERLEGQLRLAKSLERLLRKRPAEEAPSPRTHKWQAWTLADLHESEIFSILQGQLAGLSGHVDEVLKEAGCTTARSERNGARAKIDEVGRVCIELVDAKESPFELHQVAEGIWKVLATERMELDNGYYKALERVDDQVRAEFCVTLRLGRAEALVRVHILGKRVVEEDRVVMVWATVGQTEGAPFNGQRMNLTEKGWTVVKRSESDGGTRIETVVHLAPELDDAFGQKAQVGLLTDLVLGSYTLNMQRMHQTVENHLLASGVSD